ncbi:hypothetical protein JCM10212_001482 [Sporobolomyces blumeae]
MATPSIISLDFALPARTSTYKPASFAPLSPPSTSGAVFPAGPAFHAHARRILNQRSFADDDAHLDHLARLNGTQVDVDDDQDADLGGEQESRAVLEQDPRKWKEQDHYAVLGLQHLRYKATDEQIKKAHRRKVLRHHPDKQAQAGGSANDDSFFKCIAKAMETLSKLESRRQFDSVDPAVPDDYPSSKETTADNFYDLWTPVFDREARFSKVQPTPALGGPDATKDDVERFYDFWYNLDSWRSFEYEDKDVAEGADSRDEKRHQEKKNKAQRAQRKKEDIARVRTLVDTALASDPRIKAFKAAEKAARDAKRAGGAGGGAGAAVDPKVKAEEERKAKEAEEQLKKEQAIKDAQDKSDREAAKKAKESAKKNLKKAQKAITALVTAHNYFTVAGTSPAPQTVEQCFSELDLLFGALEADEVVEVKNKMDKVSSDAAACRLVLVEAAKAAEPKVGAGKFKEFA